MPLNESQRHSYLTRGVSCLKGFEPAMVARIMDKKMEAHTNYRNLQPPFLKLCNATPIFHTLYADSTRENVGFGRWALPLLKKALVRDDIFLIMRALNSIHDLVHNPEKVFEAVRLGLVERLVSLTLHEKSFIREKICMILKTIAGLEIGRRALTQRYKILHNLALLLEDEVDAVRYQAQLALEAVCQSPIAAKNLICADFMVLILRLIGGTPNTEDEDVLALHLATLKLLLLRGDKTTALKHKVMDLLIDKIDHPNEVVRKNVLDCIALLCQDPEGRAEGVTKNLGDILCKKLFDSSREVRVKTAQALAFATIHSDTRAQMCKPCTIDILMEILEDFHNAEGQFVASKALANISEDPKGKGLVQKMKKRIKSVYVGDDKELDRHIKILINLIQK